MDIFLNLVFGPSPVPTEVRSELLVRKKAKLFHDLDSVSGDSFPYRMIFKATYLLHSYSPRRFEQVQDRGGVIVPARVCLRYFVSDNGNMHAIMLAIEPYR